jgi:hypothetical protein
MAVPVLWSGDGEYTYDLHNLFLEEIDTLLYKGTLERPGEQVYNSADDGTEVQIYGNKWQIVSNGTVKGKGTCARELVEMPNGTKKTKVVFYNDAGMRIFMVSPFGTGTMGKFWVDFHKKFELGPGTGFSPSY